MTTNNITEFKKVVEEMAADFEKFYDKENGAAGARVRKHLQTLAGLCKDGRKAVTETKATRQAAKEAK